MKAERPVRGQGWPSNELKEIFDIEINKYSFLIMISEHWPGDTKHILFSTHYFIIARKSISLDPLKIIKGRAHL